MEPDEIDRTELLRSFEGAEQRARAAWEFGLLDEEFEDLATCGDGAYATANTAVFSATKSSVKARARKGKRRKKVQRPPGTPCSKCGHVDA